MSRRQAAAKAGISASQWSDVERGHKKAGSGVVVPVHATADTLARMARASASVLMSSPTLGARRRPPASNPGEERDLQRGIATIPGLGTSGAQVLSGTDGEELIPIIAAGLDAIGRSDLPETANENSPGSSTT